MYEERKVNHARCTRVMHTVARTPRCRWLLLDLRPPDLHVSGVMPTDAARQTCKACEEISRV